ncbi:D-alanyl-D-alanine carboxypeptidase, partial [Streptomyces sp. NPDC055099]
MAYEEASVAGETPDRSKQRKSSGNPTGAEPSVPAPAPEERDPRLAVAREVPAAREEASERQDNATAVFSTKAVTSGAEKRAASEEPPKGAKAPEAGDARLRAAVAAWVATADEETDAEATTPDDEKSSAPSPAGDEAPAAAGAKASEAARDEAAEESKAPAPAGAKAPDAAGSGGAAG